VAQRMTAGIIQADHLIMIKLIMDVAHVGEVVLHMAQLPLKNNILSMTIMATHMPFAGRG